MLVRNLLKIPYKSGSVISCYYHNFSMENKTNMEYRNLGPTGIKVSIISFGNWLNSNSQEAKQNTIDCVKTAWDNGINFFDTAEVYGTLMSDLRLWLS